MKDFALFLSNINEYENAIEQFEKIGLKIDYEWNEYVLNKKLITWNHDAYLVFNHSIQLHNHNCECIVKSDIKDLKIYNHEI